jgi:hypothetical protein
VDWPVSGGCNPRDRQTIVDDRTIISTNPGRHSRARINPRDLLRRQTARPQLAVVEMIPVDEMVMPWAQTEVIALANTVAMKR